MITFYNMKASESDFNDQIVFCCRRSSFRFFLYIVFYIVYLCFGAICFMWLELPTEIEAGRVLSTKRLDFLSKHTCVTMEEMDELLAAVEHANSRGVSMVGNTTTPSNWDLGHSIFFAMTIITTIGYGKTTPLSNIGKGFCILFALIGIPLTLILYSAALERIYKPIFNLLLFMERIMKDQLSSFDIRLLHLCLVGSIVGILFVIIPSSLLTYYEPKWNFLDSVYYCFISLSTIGLGDFVPGEDAKPELRTFYKIIVTIYLFLGLIGTLVFLQFFHEIPELNIGYQIYENAEVVGDNRMQSRRSSVDILSEFSMIDETNKLVHR